MTSRGIVVLLCGAALSAQPQSPTPVMTGTAAISGVVTDARTGAPLEGVLVQLGGGAAYNIPNRPRQITDARGRYVFTHLPPRTMYQIIASKAGYFDGGHQKQPGIAAWPRVELADGQWRQDVDIQMWKPASISGTVVDERGDPVVATAVQALARIVVSGKEHWAAGPFATTDDRGVYRIADLSRGDYLIHVPSVQVTVPSGAAVLGTPPRPGATTIPSLVNRASDGTGVMVGHFATPDPTARGRAYPMMYHPSARTVESAAPVHVEFGERRLGADVSMVLEPTVRISGRVVGPAEALVRLPLRLLPKGNESAGVGGEAGITQTDATGAFTFLNVPRGDYTLIAGRAYATYSIMTTVSRPVMPPGADPFGAGLSNTRVPGHETAVVNLRTSAGLEASGRLAVSVSEEDVTGLAVALTPAVTVSGHYLWDGSPTPPAGLSFAPIARIEPADGDVSIGPRTGESRQMREITTAPPITFTIQNVLPGRYVFAPPVASTSTVESIMWNGRSLLDTPLEVTGDRPVTGVVISLTSKPTGAMGTVRDSSGELATRAAVILFPAAATSWTNLGFSAIRFRTATVGRDGTYRITGVVPGDYFLAAVPDVDRSRVFDATFLPSVAASATRITIGAGTNVQHDLRVIGGGR
jgi:hypothetical protein